jgi:hypothetical protein
MIVQAKLGFFKNEKKIGERRDKLKTPKPWGNI